MGELRDLKWWVGGFFGLGVAVVTAFGPDILPDWARWLAFSFGVALILVSGAMLALHLSRTRQKGGAPQTSPLAIDFDASNQGRKFWSIEGPRDGQPRPLWEYRVAINNNGTTTVRNVSVTVERTGAMPVRPETAPFDRLKSTSCDLKPGCSELVVVLRWPTRPEAGMLAGPSASAYGPVKVTVAGDDVQAVSRSFQFDYQRTPMLFE